MLSRLSISTNYSCLNMLATSTLSAPCLAGSTLVTTVGWVDGMLFPANPLRTNDTNSSCPSKTVGDIYDALGQPVLVFEYHLNKPHETW